MIILDYYDTLRIYQEQPIRRNWSIYVKQKVNRARIWLMVYKPALFLRTKSISDGK